MVNKAVNPQRSTMGPDVEPPIICARPPAEPMSPKILPRYRRFSVHSSEDADHTCRNTAEKPNNHREDREEKNGVHLSHHPASREA